MEIIDLINFGSSQLKKNNINSYMLDSEILLSKVLNKKREELLTNSNQIVEIQKIDYFQKLIDRRSLKEPIAYILKEKEFWSKNFLVDENTLIPRPETELIVEKITQVFKEKNFILDIGLDWLYIAKYNKRIKNSKGVGIDISKKAILIAIRNAKRLNLIENTKFYKRSVDEIYHQKFDLIVSNPPYVMKKDLKNLDDDIRNFEPKLALDEEMMGLTLLKSYLQIQKYLKNKRYARLEIGNEQFKKVSNILKKNKFKTIFLIKDNRENIRCIMSTLEN